MSSLGELLATDHQRIFEFFVLGLRDVSAPNVDRQELFYNASVLADYAQVSTEAGVEWLAPKNLSEVFDHSVSDATLRQDGLMMEAAGTQCLLLAGFFEDQMRQRHNTRWYAELGSRFFSQAAVHERSSRKSADAKPDCPGASNRGVDGTRGWAARCATSPFCCSRPNRTAPAIRKRLLCVSVL